MAITDSASVNVADGHVNDPLNMFEPQQLLDLLKKDMTTWS